MLLSLDTLTQPVTEPFDMDDLKRYLRITNANSDDMLFNLAKAARQYLERELRRAFLSQTLQAVFQPMYGVVPSVSGMVYPQQYQFRLPQFPQQSVTSVELERSPGNFSVVDTSSYTVRGTSRLQVELFPDAYTDIAMLDFITRRYYPLVRITYVAGYLTIGDIPQDYLNLIYQQTEMRFLNLDGSGSGGQILQQSIREQRVPHL